MLRSILDRAHIVKELEPINPENVYSERTQGEKP